MLEEIIGAMVGAADAVLDIVIGIAERIDKYAEDHRNKI